MFTIKQCKGLKSGLVVDEVRGILLEAKEQRTVTTPRGSATVQHFKLEDPSNRDFIYGSIWDHQPLDGLVGTEIILISIKASNNHFGGVKVEDRQDKTDPTKIYKNLVVGAAGVVHTPDTYVAAFGHSVPAATATPPPSSAPTQASVPAPSRAEGVSNVPAVARTPAPVAPPPGTAPIPSHPPVRQALRRPMRAWWNTTSGVSMPRCAPYRLVRVVRLMRGGCPS